MDQEPFNHLYRDAISGVLTRRQVLKRAAAIGLSAPAIAALLAACGSSNKSTPTTASASTATSSSGGTTPARRQRPPRPPPRHRWQPQPRPRPRLQPRRPVLVVARATHSTSWWQAPTILNGHLAQGTKDFDASRVVLEPLADFDKDGNLVAVLAAEIPSLDNGAVSQDGNERHLEAEDRRQVVGW